MWLDHLLSRETRKETNRRLAIPFSFKITNVLKDIFLDVRSTLQKLNCELEQSSPVAQLVRALH